MSTEKLLQNAKPDKYESQQAEALSAFEKYQAGSFLSFNIEYGYLEAILRGFRSGFLSEIEYRQLCQCESLEDFKLCFGETDFASCLQNIEENSHFSTNFVKPKTDLNEDSNSKNTLVPTNTQIKLNTEIVVEKIQAKFVDEFDFIYLQAVGSLNTFLSYIRYDYMISNISFLIISLIKKGQPEELLNRCDPMGYFPHMKSILTFENSDDGLFELYRTVLIDTPVARYFERYFELIASQNRSLSTATSSTRHSNHRKQITSTDSSSQRIRNIGGSSANENSIKEIGRIFNEVDMSVTTTLLKRLQLEDFYTYSMSIGGITSEKMKILLEFEADRRAISIMFNSFDTSLNDPFRRNTDRKDLFCRFGSLYPDAIQSFSNVANKSQLAVVLSHYPDLYRLWMQAENEEKDLEQVFYEHEVRLNRLAFEEQGHFACFQAYVKLKEQEKRNIYQISECISQKRREAINRQIKIF